MQETLSGQVLVNRTGDGDHHALVELFDRYRERLDHFVCYRMDARLQARVVCPIIRAARNLWFLTHQQYVNDIAWSPDGLSMASASDDTTCRIWDSTPGYDAKRR